MLSLFAAAAAGGGVAQAQECVSPAPKTPGWFRAEGITEVVAEIELRCGRPEADRFGFAADIPEELKKPWQSPVPDRASLFLFLPCMRARQLARQAANPTDQIVAHTLGFSSSAVNLMRIFFELGPEQSRARSGEAYGGGYPGVFDSGFAESACPIRRRFDVSLLF